MANVEVSDSCIGCGACAGIAPEIFEMQDGKAKPKVAELNPDQIESAKSAASSCPVQAITVNE